MTNRAVGKEILEIASLSLSANASSKIYIPEKQIYIRV